MPAITERRCRWLADNMLPHEPPLRAWLASRFSGNLEIDDIIQETWAVLATLDDVAHVRNPRAYLFTVARSVILQQLRRSRIVHIESVAEIERLEIDSGQPTPEQYAASHQELRRTGELIACLPPKCRQAFILRKIEGLSQREIAQRMGISESTVEKHLGKGLRLLMKAVTQGTAGLRTEVTPADKHSKSRKS